MLMSIHAVTGNLLLMLLLPLLLLSLLCHDAPLQPTRGGPPQLDEQYVSATPCLVCCVRVCDMKAECSREARGDATGATVDRLCFCARMVGTRLLGCA